MNAFTIRDLENISGIKAHTIRIWEQRYNFLSPDRTKTNIRYYSNEELVKLLNVALLNKHGFKISHINKMQPEEIRQQLVALNSTDAQQQLIINELIEMMISMDVVRFERLLDKQIAVRGIDKMIIQVIFPFLEKIGLLWMTSRINAAQEHLVTNIIRQKLIIGIENAVPEQSVPKKILLFLPEGEHHELALLYVHFILKTKGIQVYYIGANVPVKDLAVVADLKMPDLLYTHITSGGKQFNIDRFMNYYATYLNKHTLIIGGLQAQQFRKPVPRNVMIKNTLAHVLESLQA